MKVLHSPARAPAPTAAHIAGERPVMRAYWRPGEQAPLRRPPRTWWHQMYPVDPAFVANLAILAPGCRIPFRHRFRLSRRPSLSIVDPAGSGSRDPADYHAPSLNWLFRRVSRAIIWSHDGWTVPPEVSVMSRGALSAGGNVAVVFTEARYEASWADMIAAHRPPAAQTCLVHAGAASDSLH